MKRILLATILLSSVCNAQDTLGTKGGASKVIKPANLNDGSLTANIGIGASAVELEFYNIVTGAGADFTSLSPVYSGMLDYGINEEYSIGIGVAWQSMSDHPVSTYSVLFANNSIVYGVTEHMTRTNTALQILRHFGKRAHGAHADFYSGIRVGESFWTDNTSPYTPSLDSKKRLRDLSVQLLFGYRVFVSTILALHLETGVGTPYFFEAGITVRINNTKN